mmetsp:Transcript_27764/g.29903  ORF Transcript_27764/g.29903 Transcript_27764/m.29903 type:complete len:159 (-) Transcript_27764:101-577(-)
MLKVHNSSIIIVHHSWKKIFESRQWLHYRHHHHHHHSLLLLIKLKQPCIFIFIDIDIDFNFVIVSDLLLTFFFTGPFAPCCFSSSFSSSFLLDSTSASGSFTDVSLEWRYLRQEQLLLPPPMSLFVSVRLLSCCLAVVDTTAPSSSSPPPPPPDVSLI